MRIQMRLAGHFSAVAVAAVLAGSAGAVPIAVDESAFSASATLIEFKAADLGPTGTLITNQYLGQGVLFSGGLYTNVGSITGPPGNGITQNTNPNLPPAEQGAGTPITIEFSSTMLRAGFDVTTQAPDNLRISVSAFASDGSLVSTGTVDFVTPTNLSRFVGVEDATVGIAKLVVTPFLQPGGNPNDTSQRFLMDNLRFEAIVPEPSAALLFPTGLLLAAHGLRRRRVRA